MFFFNTANLRPLNSSLIITQRGTVKNHKEQRLHAHVQRIHVSLENQKGKNIIKNSLLTLLNPVTKVDSSRVTRDMPRKERLHTSASGICNHLSQASLWVGKPARKRPCSAARHTKVLAHTQRHTHTQRCTKAHTHKAHTQRRTHTQRHRRKGT